VYVGVNSLLAEAERYFKLVWTEGTEAIYEGAEP